MATPPPPLRAFGEARHIITIIVAVIIVVFVNGSTTVAAAVSSSPSDYIGTRTPVVQRRLVTRLANGRCVLYRLQVRCILYSAPRRKQYNSNNNFIDNILQRGFLEISARPYIWSSLLVRKPILSTGQQACSRSLGQYLRPCDPVSIFIYNIDF